MSIQDDIDRDIDRDLGIKPDRAGGPHLAFIKPALRAIGKVLRPTCKVIFFPVLSPLGPVRFYDHSGTLVSRKRAWPWRVLDAVIARIVLAPVIIAVFFVTLVWLTTHPQAVRATQTPDAYRLYHRKITMATTDGSIVAGWYLPALTAGDVVLNGDAALQQKFPAAILCHGLGFSHDQYLPLASTLHDAGFAVLMLDLRGQGDSPATAVTFGLRERFDVAAGINYLRALPNVDAGKITLVGYGIGANAALHAAALDQSVAAVVVDGVWPTFAEWTKHAFKQPGVPEQWAEPLFAATFDMVLREHANQLNMEPLVRALSRQPILFIARDTPDQAPVKDIYALAATASSPHRVMVLDQATGAMAQNTPELDGEITKFLTENLHWTPPTKRISEELQNLLKAHVEK